MKSIHTKTRMSIGAQFTRATTIQLSSASGRLAASAAKGVQRPSQPVAAMNDLIFTSFSGLLLSIGPRPARRAAAPHRTVLASRPPRPGVVPEPVPALAHRVGGGGGQVLERGVAGEEARVELEHPRHLRLLQHGLRDQHRIGVARPAPGQAAAVAGVPGEEAAAEDEGDRRQPTRLRTDALTGYNGRHRWAGSAIRYSTWPPGRSPSRAATTRSSCPTTSTPCCA